MTTFLLELVLIKLPLAAWAYNDALTTAFFSLSLG